MSCSRRQILALSAASLVATSSCGFRPLYSQGAAAREIHGAFAITDGGDAFAFTMREHLRTRLGVAAAPPYRLSIATDVTEEERAIRADRSILRFNVEAVAQFAVQHSAGEAVLFQDQARAFTAYSAVASPFATRAAQEDARRRLAINLADQIVLRLAATASDWMT